jgi:hypothetical protein
VDDSDISAHRTRSNAPRPTPSPETVAEINEAMADVIEDRS